jgi:serine-type D-Ala-D-Ala carboxypeptidase
MTNGARDGMAMTRRRGTAAALLVLPAIVVALLVAGQPRDQPTPAVVAAEPSIPFEPGPAAEALVAAGVGEAYPGAVLAVGVGPRIDHLAALGRIGWRTASPPVVLDSTLYDLASLTKVMATTMAVLLLVEDGVIELDEPVRRHLPEFEGRWKDDVTWRHLLTHTSGLPAGAAIRGNTPQERARRILRTLVQVPPGTLVTYSDVGFLAVWLAAERAAGEPLPELLERRVYGPLGMNATGFAPGRDCEACAPTMRLRDGEPFRGISSDRMAREIGGISGHAGLFASGPDVARFAAMIANGGELDGVRVLSPQLAAELLTQQPGAGRRTLGWTAFCPQEPPNPNNPCERPFAFGHNGWTGTSIWIEPDTRAWTVLLSNRSYERTERPFPLDALRRDLLLLAAALDTAVPGDRWLAEARPRPLQEASEPTSTAPAPAARSAR